MVSKLSHEKRYPPTYTPTPWPAPAEASSGAHPRGFAREPLDARHEREGARQHQAEQEDLDLTQLITFGLVPSHLRIGFMNVVSLGWNAILSGFNSDARAQIEA